MTPSVELANSCKYPHEDRRAALGQNEKGAPVFFLFWRYVPELYHAVGMIAGARWRPKLDGSPWECPATSALGVLHVLRRFDFTAPAEVWEALHEAEEQERARLAEELRQQTALRDALAGLEDVRINGDKLYAHQISGARWLAGLEAINGKHIHAVGRAIVADDIGTGKTIELLLMAKAYFDAFGLPALVISRRNLASNWQREASWLGVDIKVRTWAKIPLATTRPFILIVDEAHRAQNVETERTQRLVTLALTEHCRACFLVTGTPARGGRPVNMFPLLKMARHRLAENNSHFEKYFCGAEMRRTRRKGSRQKIDVYFNQGATHLAEFKEETADVVLRRLRSECLDLPQFRRIPRPVILSDEAQRVYDRAFHEARDRYFDRLRAGKIKEGGEAFILLNHLRQANSMGKVEETCELAAEVLEQDGAPLIFTDYVDSAEQIAAHFRAQGCRVELLTGKTKEDSQRMKDRFQAGRSDLWVSTIQSGGEGLTLTRSNSVIMHDRAWLIDDNTQAEGRAYRSTQRRGVLSYWMQAGRVDARLDARLFDQAELLEAMALGSTSTRQQMTAKQIAVEVAAEVFAQAEG